MHVTYICVKQRSECTYSCNCSRVCVRFMLIVEGDTVALFNNFDRSVRSLETNFAEPTYCSSLLSFSTTKVVRVCIQTCCVMHTPTHAQVKACKGRSMLYTCCLRLRSNPTGRGNHLVFKNRWCNSPLQPTSATARCSHADDQTRSADVDSDVPRPLPPETFQNSYILLVFVYPEDSLYTYCCSML